MADKPTLTINATQYGCSGCTWIYLKLKPHKKTAAQWQQLAEKYFADHLKNCPAAKKSATPKP